MTSHCQAAEEPLPQLWSSGPDSPYISSTPPSGGLYKGNNNEEVPNYHSIIVAFGVLFAGCTALVVGGTAVAINEAADDMEDARLAYTAPDNPDGDDICFVDGKDWLGDLSYTLEFTNIDAAGSVQMDLVFYSENNVRLGDSFFYMPNVRSGEFIVVDGEYSMIEYAEGITCEIADTTYYAGN